jgi:ankyrin repeat protein
LKLIIDKCLVEDPSKRPKWSDIVYEIQNALIESYCDA